VGRGDRGNGETGKRGSNEELKAERKSRFTLSPSISQYTSPFPGPRSSHGPPPCLVLKARQGSMGNFLQSHGDIGHFFYLVGQFFKDNGFWSLLQCRLLEFYAHLCNFLNPSTQVFIKLQTLSSPYAEWLFQTHQSEGSLKDVDIRPLWKHSFWQIGFKMILNFLLPYVY
jgi:hypothetical protein